MTTTRARRPTTVGRLFHALSVALIVGVLMSGCGQPPSPGEHATVGPAKNPHKAINGASVSPSQGLKDAATDAYKLHYGLMSVVDPSYFSGQYPLRPSERRSSESPAYKDGNSYWYLSSNAYLIGGLDIDALFERIKAFLESQGYAMTRDNREGKLPGVPGSVDFRKDGPVDYVRLNVGGSDKDGLIGLFMSTKDFPNPPESEWPKPGVNETWKPSVPLWPAGVGPSKSASPTP